jgi:type IV secretory pathway component VirB8
MFGTQIDKAYPESPTQTMFSGYSANNKYLNFPPLMNDARSLVGGYTPEAITNAKIIQDNGIENNTQYREFMTKNAIQSGDENRRAAINDIGFTYRSVDLKK